MAAPNAAPTQRIYGATTERFIRKATNEEAKHYDFVSARGIRKTTNLVESVAHIVKSCLGSGVVAIHESYKNCGLLTAVILNFFLGFAVFYCMYILAYSAQIMYGRVQVPSLTFPELAEASFALGPWVSMKKYSRIFRYVVDATIIVDLFCSCCVYQVVVARTVKQLIDHTDAIDESVPPSIRVYILALLVPCMLLCMIRTLKYLAPFSLVADAFIFLVAGSTVYYGIQAADRSVIELPSYKSIPGVLEFMGVCVFSMEGIGATLAIENQMTYPKDVGLVNFIGMAVVIALVTVVGFFGYWGFGEASASPVTVNFPWTPFPVTLRALMGIIIYVTYALNFWIPFELVWFYIKRRHNPSKYWIWERVWRAFFVTVITLVAILLPNVSNFMGLIGTLCLSFMGFIFPAIIELAMIWEDPGLGVFKWRLQKAVWICIFAILMCILGTYSNFKDLIQSVYMT